jgi:hypothetical protein
LRDGAPFAAAYGLSHTSQLKVLETAAPQALARAVVVGDPCFDILVANLPLRERFRRALAVGDRALVLVSTTWSSESTFGRRAALVRELLAELPRDSYQVCVVVHPNVTHRHGPGVVRGWFADCLRAGLRILPEIDGWRAGLIAADIVIGDSGSVTGYGAALGRATLLAMFPDVPPGTVITELGRGAEPLPPRGPYLPHLERARAGDRTAVLSGLSELVTTEPGRAMALLRRLCYRAMGLSEPDWEVPIPAVSLPQVEAQCAAFADQLFAAVTADGRVELSRHPVEVLRPQIGLRTPDPRRIHLSCSIDYPIRSLLNRADVLCGLTADSGDNTTGWLRRTLDDNPGCSVAALIGEQQVFALVRGGDPLVLWSRKLPSDALASVLFAWLQAGHGIRQLPTSIQATIGSAHDRVDVAR